MDKIKLEKQIDEKNINITSINTQAVKKTFRKKVSLMKKLIIAGLVATTTVGAVAGGLYIYQQHQKVQQEKAEKEQQIFNEIDKIMYDELETPDLIELKEQYGDLFYLVEPMTNKQIDEQWQAIRDYANIASDFSEKNTWHYNEFGFSYESQEQRQQIYDQVSEEEINTFSNVYNSNYPELWRYQQYYDAAFFNFRTAMIVPYLAFAEDISQIPMELKEAYIRYWKTMFAINVKVREKNGLDNKPYFLQDENLTSSIDFDKQIVYIKR